MQRGPGPAGRMAEMLRTRTLPRLVAAGTFGQDWIIGAVDVAPIGGLGEDHWASTTLTVTLQLRRPQGQGSEERTVDLVAKCMLPDDGFAGYNHADVQAKNEVNMYSKVLPFFERLAEGSGVSIADLHPKCFLAETDTEGLLSLTLMENLRAKGFTLSKQRLELDLPHIKQSLRALGRLHAVSHAAKARCRDEFFGEVVPLLGEACYTEAHRALGGQLQYPFRRGLKRLAARIAANPTASEEDKACLRRLEALAEDAYSIMVRAATGQEPAGVITHGDFCRNNMKFRYDADGQPIDVCFFDLQNSRYASPSVDLALFLLLHTSAVMREAHWDALLKEYHDSLQGSLDRLLDGHAVHQDFVRPTWQDLLDDLKRNGLFGYVICGFFLPQMMVPPDEMLKMDDIKDICGDAAAGMPEDMIEKMNNVGGEKATDALADVLQFFVDKRLL